MTDIDTDFVYSSEDFLGWALTSGWRPHVLPVGVVFTFQTPVTRALSEQTDRFAENSDLTVSNASMFMTTDDGRPVVVACLNPGAASMVTQMEHLRLLSGDDPLAAVIVGTAGAIAGHHRTGDTVIVGSALRTDGISDDYLPPSPTVSADCDLTERLSTRIVGATVARSWTVRVPYRSTRSDLLAAREGGAEVVEMETASLFAAGQALNVRTAAVVIVSDVHMVDEPVSVDWSDTLAPTLRALDSAIGVIRSL
jgi:AMP nucleosidase